MEGMTQFNKVHDILGFHVNKNPDGVTVSIDTADYKNTDILSKVSDLVHFLREKEIKSGEEIKKLSKKILGFGVSSFAEFDFVFHRFGEKERVG